jgi:hypothetical protein
MYLSILDQNVLGQDAAIQGIMNSLQKSDHYTRQNIKLCQSKANALRSQLRELQMSSDSVFDVRRECMRHRSQTIKLKGKFMGTQIMSNIVDQVCGAYQSHTNDQSETATSLKSELDCLHKQIYVAQNETRLWASLLLNLPNQKQEENINSSLSQSSDDSIEEKKHRILSLIKQLRSLYSENQIVIEKVTLLNPKLKETTQNFKQSLAENNSRM